MTVNTDTMGEIQQYDIVRDSSAELRNPRANPVVVQDEFDPLANDADIYISDNKTDDDDFEVVSHVKKEPKMPYHGAGPGRADSKGKGKGKVPAKVDPDEPPENLLASFGESDLLSTVQQLSNDYPIQSALSVSCRRCKLYSPLAVISVSHLHLVKHGPHRDH